MSAEQLEIDPAHDAVAMPFEEEHSILRRKPGAAARHQRSGSTTTAYVWLPVIFLIVTMLGGLRLGAADGSFTFNRPQLICLVFALLTMILYVRSGMIDLKGWLDERRPFLENTAGVATLFAIYAATVQIYNSVLPETGLTFWVVGFCFLWTLWNNIFAELSAAKLLRSILALFGFAFAVKYLILANVTAAPDGSWWRRLFENPGKEAFTWLLDLPKYGVATGYVQFATLCFYMIGLYLTPSRTTADLPDRKD